MGEMRDELALCRNQIKQNLEQIVAAGLYAEALQVIKEAEAILGYDAELRAIGERILRLQSERGEPPASASKEPAHKARILVGSVVRGTPLEISELLSALEGLNRSGLEVDFSFLDDSDSVESTRLLASFRPAGAEMTVVPAGTALADGRAAAADPEAQARRNAALKDFLLTTARERGHDFLLLLEPGVILHPHTLQQLTSLNRDLVAPIIWDDGPAGLRVPQVWLRDADTRFMCGRGEQIGVEESLVRQFRFLEALKRPGVYEVGGIKDCLLISRNALEKGVSFREIENLSLPGEYTHFCIRAAALGLPLCVDTHVPAYRLAPGGDRDGLVRYRRDVTGGRALPRQRVALVHPNPSGSNTLALDKYAPDYIRDRYEISLVEPDNSTAQLASLLDADAVIVTDGSYSLNKPGLKPNQVAVDLWHGFPLKAVGWRDKNQPAGLNAMLAPRWRNLDWIGSYSPLFSELMEECLQTGTPDKFRIVGAPRNDFLFKSDGRANLERVLQRPLQGERIVFYAPTYRSAPGSIRRNDADRDWTNVFAMPEFDASAFNRYLEDNAITLVVKLHPAEESAVARCISQSRRINLVTNADLKRHGIDFYETMNAADLLISDYSSIFFDYLLLDRPVMFVPTDLAQYAGNRGLLLEPYEDWAPGPKALDQSALEREILRSLADRTYYRAERETVTSQVHQYRDGDSAARVWQFVDQLLRERSGI
ncbi:MAG: CDP-glycerol glycerophosphotransferase family protein [Methanocella sp.]